MDVEILLEKGACWHFQQLWKKPYIVKAMELAKCSKTQITGIIYSLAPA